MVVTLASAGAATCKGFVVVVVLTTCSTGSREADADGVCITGARKLTTVVVVRAETSGAELDEAANGAGAPSVAGVSGTGGDADGGSLDPAWPLDATVGATGATTADATGGTVDSLVGGTATDAGAAP